MHPIAARVVPPRILEKHLAARIERLRDAADLPLAIELWNGRRFQLGPQTQVCIRLRRPSALVDLVAPSLDRLGSAYVDGRLDLDGKPADIIAVGVRLAELHARRTRSTLTPRARHNRAADARSIAHHYDVSNDFYAAWLDREMVYSCAYFRSAVDSLEQAQAQKLDHILTKLRLRPGQRLLDIGCGWGALIVRAARDFGASAVGLTLSQAQYDYARARIARAGLADCCEVRLLDYRDADGEYDCITSIGMFEHVGVRKLAAYFAKVRDLLAPQGVLMNHGVTSGSAESAETPFGGGRFIDRYVFPQGELPHLSLALQAMARAGLEVGDVENLRAHYALTLHEWSRRFEAAGGRLRALAGEQRYRAWRLYLAGCAYAFERGWIELHQILAYRAKLPPARLPLPLTRDYMYTARRAF